MDLALKPNQRPDVLYDECWSYLKLLEPGKGIGIYSLNQWHVKKDYIKKRERTVSFG